MVVPLWEPARLMKSHMGVELHTWMLLADRGSKPVGWGRDEERAPVCAGVHEEHLPPCDTTS